MTSKTKTPPLYLGIFFVSAAILHLEILQTRIFSVMLWHHVTYLVVTFTLLGFAAAGAFVAVRPSILKGNLPKKLCFFSGLFGLTAVASFLVLTVVRLDTVDLLKDRIQYFILFIYYIYLIVPYFFGGLVICMLLSAMTEDVNRLYFVNMVGSGAGCLLFLPVITPAGGAGSVMIVSGIAFLGVFFFGLSCEKPKAPALAGLLLFALSMASLPFSESMLHIRPAPSKVMSVMVEKEGWIVENTRWDPLCRVDVARHPENGVREFFQDGDAPTMLMKWKPGATVQTNHYSLAYFIQEKPRVLIIGVGGGQDLVTALQWNSSSVTGAEINPSIDALMRYDYNEISGGLYTDSDAEVVVEEGRSFLRRSNEKYDVIQMTGTDTYSALSSGSFILSESYLYTLEAFTDYLNHLTPNGVAAVLRFRFFPPRECLRLVSIGAQAMKNQGIDKPGKHIVVVTYDRPYEEFDGKKLKIAYAVMLFKKTPFTMQEVRKYKRFCRDYKTTGRYVLSYAPGVEGCEREFVEFFESMDKGGEDDFYANYLYDVTPVSDDRPFFFGYHKWKNLFGGVTSPNYLGVIGEDPVGLYILLSVLLETVLLVALLVILPLLVFRRKGLKVPFGGRIIFYFFAIGVSYMFIEIACMQKFVLFLGHPTYSLSIVLFSFLLFSGIGSFFGRRFHENPMKGISLAAVSIAILLLLYEFVLPVVFAHGLQLPGIARMGLTVVLLAPLAFFMGMPFPLGLKTVSNRYPGLVPWAFGINGGASVVSSVVSITLAMALGFTAVFLVAGILYLAAWFLFRKLSLSSA